MEWTIKDTLVLTAMALAVIGLSFTAPALGVGSDSDEVATGDVPEFNTTTDRFDFAGDLPEFPIRPDRGFLNSSSTKFDNSRGSIQNEIGTDVDGNRTFLVAISNDTVHIADVTNGSVHSSTTFTSNGQTETLSHDGFDIDVHAVDISAGAGEYEYEVTNRPGDSTVLGSLFNAADDLTNVVAYIFVSIVVLSQMLLQFVFNVGLTIVNLAGFVIDLFHWQITTYQSITSAATSWAAVFVLLPALVLFYQFAKMVIIIVEVVYPLA